MSTTSSTFSLSPDALKELSSLTAKTLNEDNIAVEDAERLQSAVEQVLKLWLDSLGEGSECHFYAGKKLGRQFITLGVVGKRVNPFGNEEDCVVSGGTSVQTILSNYGLVPSYHYVGGENQITILPKRKKINPIIYLGVALLLGVVVGLSCHLLPVDMRHTFSTAIVEPIFNAFIGILIAFAIPMMFLTLIWGIFSIGDTATLGHVGKKVIGRYLGRIVVALLVCLAISIPFFNFTLNGGVGGTGDFKAILDLILSIVPSNLITPFAEGNSLQIIFIAVVVGLAILVLKKKIPVVVQFLGQTNSIIQLIMEWITTILPFIVFISILNLMLKDVIEDASQFLTLFIVLILVVIVNMFLLCCEVSIFKKVSPKVLIKKIAPTFLIAITTASSVATFATNIECCEKKMGIKKNLVDFGVSLGAAFSRPGHATTFFCVCLFMADFFNVAITPSWVFLALLTSGLLALSVPPVPGGGIACYSILFLQLGIPIEALAIAVVLEIILDFIGTALNMVAVPADLVMVADKLDMLDKDVLRKEN